MTEDEMQQPLLNGRKQMSLKIQQHNSPIDKSHDSRQNALPEWPETDGHKKNPAPPLIKTHMRLIKMNAV